MHYVNAERVKYKRTMAKRIGIFVPIIMVLFTFLAAGIYSFQYSCMYWWYMFPLQGMVGVLCFYSQKIEESSGYQQFVYALPVDLKKISRVKNMVVLGKLFLMESVFTFFVWITPVLLFPDYQVYSLGKLILGNLIIVLTSAWQIPFCSFFMRKFGKLIPIAVHVMRGIATSVLVGKTKFWIVWPYCWTGKEMEYFLGIRLSGTLLENPVTWKPEHIVAVVLSVLLYLVFLHFDAEKVSKGELI